MKKIEPFKKQDGQYVRTKGKVTQYVGLLYAKGFNAAIREMDRVNK